MPLDSVGCGVFWESLKSINLHGSWSLVEAFCHTVAHEVGHGIGMFAPHDRVDSQGNSLGCIMTHHPDDSFTQQKKLYVMEFWGENIDNRFSGGDMANAINVKDVLGVNTTNFTTGSFF